MGTTVNDLKRYGARYSRRRFLKGAARLGAGAAAVAFLGGRGIHVRAAEVGPRVVAGVKMADIHESTRDQFARGRRRGVEILGQGSAAVLQSPAGGEFVSQALELPFEATHLGLHWKTRNLSPQNLTFAVQASVDGQRWSGWQPLSLEAIADLSDSGVAIPVHGQPDLNQVPRASEQSEVFASLASVDRATLVQYRAKFRGGESGALEDVTITALNSEVNQSETAVTLESVATQVTLENHAGTSINVVTREGWGADDSLRFDGGAKKWPEAYVPGRAVFVHHTATSNSYSDGAAEVRAIFAYHAQTLDWGDIGYNALVDRFGTIYEGRHGRGDTNGPAREVLSDDVVAGHVFAYNYGTTGIAAIGNSSTGTWDRFWGNAGLGALEDIVTFECGRQYLDPQGSSGFLRSDNIWHQGALGHCVGHRDADGDGGATACPGSRLYSYLNNTLRAAVAARLAAKGGGSPITLTGEQDGNRLAFNWDGPGDYQICLEGWFRVPGDDDVDYLSGYVSQFDQYQDPEAMAQAWLAAEYKALTLSVGDAGQYTMHVRTDSNVGWFEERLTFLVDEITDEPATGSIDGTVTDQKTAAGIAGATVAVENTGLQATTDEAGFYLIESVPVGGHTVTATADGYEPVSKNATLEDDGDSATVDFSLSPLPTGSITGTVTGQGDDAGGIVGASITAEGPEGFVASTTTGENGSYAVPDVPVGEYALTASAAGYQSQTEETVLVQADQAAVVDFALVLQDVELSHSMHVASLDGNPVRQGPTWYAQVVMRVEDNVGNPVEDALVTGVWSGGFSGSAECVTGSDGTCTTRSGDIPNRIQSVTLSISEVSHDDLDYDQESSQTTVTVQR
jgi:hypothetical protein